jgi:SAM-dependent methyltransferase
MAHDRVSGTEGYAEEASALFEQYESYAFTDIHAPILHLIPDVPRDVLDIGAGTGRDAAAFAAQGHRVVAVEPIAELRAGAAERHRSSRIEWIDDSLPDLSAMTTRGETFDVIMLNAVWMHLDAAQRQAAMSNVAPLLRAEGVMFLSLRHGPVPQGRRMFEVTAHETIQLAQSQALTPVLNLRREAVLPANKGISWTRLAFVKPKS